MPEHTLRRTRGRSTLTGRDVHCESAGNEPVQVLTGIHPQHGGPLGFMIYFRGQPLPALSRVVGWVVGPAIRWWMR